MLVRSVTPSSEKSLQGARTTALEPLEVTTLIRHTFALGTALLQNLDLGDCPALQELGDDFLRGSAITSFKPPKGITKIGSNFCASCPNLEEIDLEDCTSLTSIGEAFAAESGVKKVKLPDAVHDLGPKVCDGCAAGCIRHIGRTTLWRYMDSLHENRSTKQEEALVKSLITVLQQEAACTVAQCLLVRGDVMLFLSVFDPTNDATARNLRYVGGSCKLPPLPADSFVTIDDAGKADFALSLYHWATVLFPHAIKKMPLTTEIVAAQTARGYSVLHYAIMYRCDYVIISTLLAVASPSAILQRFNPGVYTAIFVAPLHLAVAYRHHEAVRMMLEKDGGCRVDPTQAITDKRCVPFKVDAYDLALLEWGRAREKEMESKDKQHEVESWKYVVTKLMEGGDYIGKIDSKYDLVVPVTSMCSGLAFFVMFLLYVLSSPLIFDVAVPNVIGATVETAAKNCLESYNGATALYNAFRHGTFSCSLNTTNIVIGSCVVEDLPNPSHRHHYYRYISFKSDQFALMPDPSTGIITLWSISFSTTIGYVGLNNNQYSYQVLSELKPSSSSSWTTGDYELPTGTFAAALKTLTYHHRVTPANFSPAWWPWIVALWIVTAMCGLATVYHAVDVLRNAFQFLYPLRFSDRPVQLIPTSREDIAFSALLVVMEALVVAFGFYWSVDFAVLASEDPRLGSWDYFAWRYARVQEGARLLTGACALPAFFFARRVWKQKSVFMTNVIAASVGLACMAIYGVTLEEAMRVSDTHAHLKVPALFLSPSLLVFIGKKLRPGPIANVSRQWHYRMLCLQRMEHTEGHNQRTMQHKGATQEGRGHPDIAGLVGRRRPLRVPYTAWRSLQHLTIGATCVVQLLLYAVIVYIGIAPAFVDAPDFLFLGVSRAWW